MYKLIRFYNQNRKKIFKIILIIVLIIGLIQLLNYFAKQSNSLDNIQKNTINNNGNQVNSNEKDKEIISNKSLVSGTTVQNEKLQRDADVIDEFISYCNKKDINSAYNLLTEECKEVMFPSIQDFYNVYYINIFKDETKTYTVENWTGSTYQVRFTEDILSSGKLNGNETKQDYITVVKEEEEKKLNINNFIRRKIDNKETENRDIKIKIISIDTYMDYEIYNLDVQNNSENTILLDISDDVKSVYLLDSKNMKYQFYNNEIIENKMIVKNKFTNNLQIKFTNTYSSSRRIEKLVFSKLILDYDEYNQIEDKSEYKDFYEFRVNV